MPPSDSDFAGLERISDLSSFVKGAQWLSLRLEEATAPTWRPAFQDVPETGRPKVVIVRNAIVLSNPAVIGVYQDEQLQLFTESSPYRDRNQELRRLTFECVQPHDYKTAIYKKMMPLCLEWSDNFWHWMTEYLPYALEMERLGFDGSYLVPSGNLFCDSLHFFGVSKDRIVVRSAHVSLIEEMYMCERSDGQTAKHPLLIRAMRDAVARRFAPALPRRPYIARRTRVIVNDSDVIDILQPYGFETVYMEDLSFVEQMKLSCSAEFVCGAHGAGLTAAMFMKDRGALLEMFAPTYVNPCMLGVCQSLDHRYAMVVSRQYREEPYQYGLDVFVDLASLKAALTLLTQ